MYLYSVSNFGIQRDTPSSCVYVLSLIWEEETHFFIATLSSQYMGSRTLWLESYREKVDKLWEV